MKIREIISACMTLVLSCALFMCSTTDSSAASKTSYDLPVKATIYVLERDENQKSIPGSWRVGGTETFKYNKKGHLTKYVEVYRSGFTNELVKKVQTTKWKYKNGKIAGRITKCSVKSKSYNDKSKWVGTYDSKGNLKKETISDKYGKKTSTYSFSFKINKNGWCSEKQYTLRNQLRKQPVAAKFHKNGMPKSVSKVNTTDSFSCKFKIKVNKKGLVTELSGRTTTTTFYTNPSTSKTYYTYTFDEKGRVKTAVETEGGKAIRKVVYTYGKSKTTDKRSYFGIMNHDTPAAMLSVNVLPALAHD